jgi:hypothetical protein
MCASISSSLIVSTESTSSIIFKIASTSVIGFLFFIAQLSLDLICHRDSPTYRQRYAPLAVPLSLPRFLGKPSRVF